MPDIDSKFLDIGITITSSAIFAFSPEKFASVKDMFIIYELQSSLLLGKLEFHIFHCLFPRSGRERATDTDLSLVVEYATTDSKEKYEGLSR